MSKKANLRAGRKRMRKLRKGSESKSDSMRDGRRKWGCGIVHFERGYYE